MTHLNRRIDFSGASDTRSYDGTGSIRGCTLTFIVEGAIGQASFVVQTNWHLPRGRSQFFNMGNWQMLLPFGKAVLVDDIPVGDDALIDKMFEIMIERGEEAVFEALERLYRRSFGMSTEAVIEVEVIQDDPISPKLLP